MIKDLLADPKIQAELHMMAMGLITLLGTVVGWLFKQAGQWFIAKTKSEHNALYAVIAARLVAYANQKLIDDTNDDKALYVAQELKKKFPALPEDEIQHLLEEAVVNFKAELQPNTAEASASPDGTVTATVTTEKPKGT